MTRGHFRSSMPRLLTYEVLLVIIRNSAVELFVRGLVQTICGNLNIIVTLSFYPPPPPPPPPPSPITTSPLRYLA